TKGRLLAMIKNAVPEAAAAAEAKIDEVFKEGVQGRQLKGVPPDGPIFVVLPKLPGRGQEEPALALLVRVTKYREFLNGWLKEDERKAVKGDPGGFETTTIAGEAVHMLERKGYAVFTNRKAIALGLIKQQPGLDSKLSKDTPQQLLKADASVYVDMVAINKPYGGQIKDFRQLFDAALGQGGEGTLDKQTLELIRTMYGSLFQLLADSRSFLATAEFRPEGLAVHTQVRVGDDTKSN